jgi:hypothetical protein
MEAAKPPEIKPWLRRGVEAAGALGAMPPLFEGHRMKTTEGL